MTAGRRALRWSLVFAAVVLLVQWRPATGQEAPAPALTAEQQEVFLKKAKVVRTRSASKGVTNTIRATLTDGVVTHDASIQTIDEYMQVFRGKNMVELNFRDSWRYNIAAYKLNLVLQLGRIPVSVERIYNSKVGSFTWWVDDVLMDEAERVKRKEKVPDTEAWNRQMWHVRVFDQLIYNVDRNLGNLVIDKSWNLWMIDHSRAFRLFETIKTPVDLRKIERGALDRLKGLDEASLSAAVGTYLTSDEKKRMLQRRDVIVTIFEKAGDQALFEATPPQR
jgi:hypothetical protein